MPVPSALHYHSRGEKTENAARVIAGRGSAPWDMLYHGVGYSCKAKDSHKSTNVFATGGHVRGEATARQGNLCSMPQISGAEDILSFGAQGVYPKLRKKNTSQRFSLIIGQTEVDKEQLQRGLRTA